MSVLFWVFAGVLAVVYVLTMAALVIALRRSAPRPDPLARDPAAERRTGIVVGIAAAATAATVAALTGLSYGSQKAFFGTKDGAVTILVNGRQWWWQITYEDHQPARTFVTANELHIPVGEPVLLKLEATDVIHSFWVPSLAGKLDLIPGRQNQLQIEADRPGTYRGQCAEFCGLQHAHMGITVVAEPREDFDRWREAQIAAAETPKDAERRRGMEIFVSRPCVMCHQVRGTSASASVGPDLTHVGSRRTIAAGTLATTRGNLAAWIIDPQSIKPGVHMPVIQLPADEVQPLAAYLEGLK